MNLHKQPLTYLEREGLINAHLDIDKPSQLSDCFRLGVKWALENKDKYPYELCEERVTVKEGDKVRIVGGKDAYLCLWVPDMNKYIGTVRIVLSEDNGVCILDGIDEWYFDESWLELIEED